MVPAHLFLKGFSEQNAHIILGHPWFERKEIVSIRPEPTTAPIPWKGDGQYHNDDQLPSLQAAIIRSSHFLFIRSSYFLIIRSTLTSVSAPPKARSSPPG